MQLIGALVLLSCVLFVHGQGGRPGGRPGGGGGAGQCRGVVCQPLSCANQFTPPGSCCPICRSVPAPVNPGPLFPPTRPGPIGRPGGRPGGLPPRCRNVQCRPLRCPRQFRPPGACCPICRNCATTVCPLLRRCPFGQYTPPRQCCPVCRPDPCATTLCPLLRRCPFGQYTPPGQCCPVCRPDPCATTVCPLLRRCPFGRYTPPGQCCPICRPDPCARTVCPLLRRCPFGQYTPRGQCCPVCRQDPCATAVCPLPGWCQFGQYTPQGQCCPVCRQGPMFTPAAQALSLQSGCYDGGQFYAEGAIVPSLDQCDFCQCLGGSVECQKPVCEPISCEEQDSYIPQGECCPQCP